MLKCFIGGHMVMLFTPKSSLDCGLTLNQITVKSATSLVDVNLIPLPFPLFLIGKQKAGALSIEVYPIQPALLAWMSHEQYCQRIEDKCFTVGQWLNEYDLCDKHDFADIYFTRI